MTSVDQPSPQPARPPQAGSFATAWTLFRVRGVPVRIDRSWLFMAGFVVYIFYGRLQGGLPGFSGAAVLGLAIAGALLFFASILAHELGHAFTSLDRDIPVHAITMFAMGGVTESYKEATRARDEFIIVGIGPFISLVLAALFGLVFTLVETTPAAATLMGYLAWTNLGLAAFNVIPGYPLDGGRLLRSILWGITRKPHQATRWAARVGQAFALLLIGVGVLAFATGGSYGDLWEVLIGLFLFRGATASYKRARLREGLQARTIRDLMGSVPSPLPATMSLGEAIRLVQERPSLLWPVGDPLEGGLLLSQIDAVPDRLWDTVVVGEVASPAAQVAVDVGQGLEAAFVRMAESPQNMLLVTESGRAIGLLTPSLVSVVEG
jgi:Zn-dependent protease